MEPCGCLLFLLFTLWYCFLRSLPGIIMRYMNQSKEEQRIVQRIAQVRAETLYEKSIPPFEEFVEPEMVFINGGTFNMGSNNGADNEKPIHMVTVSDFYIGIYPVTDREYCLYQTCYPIYNLPIVNITWDDARNYCKWLSEKTGKNYRLPTEAEWEYACRAGSKRNYYWGDDMDGNYCWYEKNSGRKIHPVGKKTPNDWGLYDMSGNVSEWCSDWYGYYQSYNNMTNPTGPKSGTDRIFRGGSCCYNDNYCRSSVRGRLNPAKRYDQVGFRVVRTP